MALVTAALMLPPPHGPQRTLIRLDPYARRVVALPCACSLPEDEFGFGDCSSVTELRTKFRKQATRLHPDAPQGSAESFQRLVSTYEARLQEMPSALDSELQDALGDLSSVLSQLAQQTAERALAGGYERLQGIMEKMSVSLTGRIEGEGDRLTDKLGSLHQIGALFSTVDADGGTPTSAASGTRKAADPDSTETTPITVPLTPIPVPPAAAPRFVQPPSQPPTVLTPLEPSPELTPLTPPTPPPRTPLPMPLPNSSPAFQPKSVPLPPSLPSPVPVSGPPPLPQPTPLPERRRWRSQRNPPPPTPPQRQPPLSPPLRPVPARGLQRLLQVIGAWAQALSERRRRVTPGLLIALVVGLGFALGLVWKPATRLVQLCAP